MAPASRVTFADIQMYLEAIANNPQNKRKVDNSDHKRFWNTTYQKFITGPVPNEDCGDGAPIPIVNKDPAQCAFYQALKAKSGWCELGQMPKGGPFITDTGYTVKLSNQTTISGADIDANIVWWLTHNMPEK
jgi:hypothetical protein